MPTWEEQFREEAQVALSSRVPLDQVAGIADEWWSHVDETARCLMLAGSTEDAAYAEALHRFGEASVLAREEAKVAEDPRLRWLPRLAGTILAVGFGITMPYLIFGKPAGPLDGVMGLGVLVVILALFSGAYSLRRTWRAALGATLAVTLAWTILAPFLFHVINQSGNINLVVKGHEQEAPAGVGILERDQMLFHAENLRAVREVTLASQTPGAPWPGATWRGDLRFGKYLYPVPFRSELGHRFAATRDVEVARRHWREHGPGLIEVAEAHAKEKRAEYEAVPHRPIENPVLAAGFFAPFGAFVVLLFAFIPFLLVALLGGAASWLGRALGRHFRPRPPRAV